MTKPDLSIRTLLPSDLAFCTRLVVQAGWNQLDADWLRAMALNPAGCFLAEWDGVPAATTTTCRFAEIAWVAMVLVDEAARNRGVGQAIMAHAVDHLESSGIETIRLDATIFGKGLYEKMGFESEYEVIRFSGVAALTNSGHSERIDSLPLPEQLLALGKAVTGTSANDFLNALHRVEAFYQYFDADRSVVGYAGARAGRNAVQIGPAVAATPDAGNDVLNALMARWNGNRVFIDIPADNQAALHWAEMNGLTEQRRFVRMYKGKKVADRPDMIWASSGPEKG